MLNTVEGAEKQPAHAAYRVNPNIHTHVHTRMHVYMHVHTHRHTHTYIHTCIHAYMHACIHTCMHVYIHRVMVNPPLSLNEDVSSLLYTIDGAEVAALALAAVAAPGDA